MLHKKTTHNLLSTHALDALLISSPTNIRYLSGFVGTNGYLLLTRKQSFLITDFRYLTQAKKQSPGFNIIDMRAGLGKTIATLLKKPRATKCGFEAHHITAALHAYFKKELPGIFLKPITTDPALIRVIKSPKEIALLERAHKINQKAFAAIRKFIRPGMRESDVARELEFALRRAGAEKLAFDTIVASGVRGALPHGVASNKKIKRGELVTVDFGGVYQGYHADETVTVCVGAPSAKQKEIHDIVRTAQQAAARVAGPGVSCAELDSIAREYITEKGYGKYFGHALGHGVGLEVHERPVLSPKSKDVLKPGMVFTIEPGIYIPGWGGVRIEDVFVCTKNGVRQITKNKKTL